MEYPDQGAEALCGKMAKSLYKRPETSAFNVVDVASKSSKVISNKTKTKTMDLAISHVFLLQILG